ncbi:MAG TPA: hypothetical protein VHB70_05255 [Parafilimonas sp.]|nr:hypothetical protein [Parafilimonas sp.]
MKPLLTALLLLVFFNCIAQKNLDSLFFAKMQNRKISLPEKSSSDSIFNLPFHDVQIIDARADTTSIGFLKTMNVTNKLIFKNEFSEVYRNYIQEHYHLTNDSNNLLILLKTFRITRYAEISGESDINVMDWKGGCLISAELFLVNNSSYHALYKVDTLLIETSENETVSELTAQSFRLILKRSENKNLSEMHVGKTAFSFTDIERHINDFYEDKILKDSILNKGVYKNFNEFKSNRPSISNYEVHKGRLSDELFVTENSQTYPIHDFWGYCDGHSLYIKSADNLFQLKKAGNTFNIRGIKSLKRGLSTNDQILSGITSAAIGLPITSRGIESDNKNYTAEPTAFQLDMQTGELY